MNKRRTCVLSRKNQYFQCVYFMTINMIKCIQKKENEPQRAEKERGKYKMMKKELTMEELEQVAGGDLGSYVKAIGAGFSTGWRIFVNELFLDKNPDKKDKRQCDRFH